MSEYDHEDAFDLYDPDGRLRAANRAAGHELTEQELRHAEHGAELLTEVFFLDSGTGWADDTPMHRIANGLSVEAINAWNAYRHDRNAKGDTKFKSLGPMPTTHSTAVWRARRSISDLDNPFRQPKLLCIVAADPKKAYPLDAFDDWMLVRRELMGPCDVRIAANCHKTCALKTMALVRGEYVTVHQVCGPCWNWPYDGSAKYRRYDLARVEELLALANTGVQ